MNKRISRLPHVLAVCGLLWALLFPAAGLADFFAFPAGGPRLITEYNPEQPYFPGKYWLKADSPELMGWSAEKLGEARAYSASLNTSAVVVVENGVIVDEWGEPQKRIKLHSVRKSLMNALYGVQVDAGTIRLSDTLEILGVDDKAPQLSNEEKQATISELLQARSGVYHEAAYETAGMRTRRPVRGSHPHGTHWFYNNWDFNALVTIYEQKTGMPMGKAFYEQIANPLNMEQFRISDAHYLVEPEKSRHPALLFAMSARDLARFGLLYLHKGKWGGRRILSESWVEESTMAHTHFPSRNGLQGYGYLWWVSNNGFVAVGAGGQTLLVIPELRLVIVHLAERPASRDELAHAKVAKLMRMIVSAHPSRNSDRGSRS